MCVCSNGQGQKIEGSIAENLLVLLFFVHILQLAVSDAKKEYDIDDLAKGCTIVSLTSTTLWLVSGFKTLSISWKYLYLSIDF